MLYVMTACHAHFAIFSFYAHFAIFSFFNFFKNFHFSLKLFLICSYFSGDLSLTVLIKCVFNYKKSVVFDILAYIGPDFPKVTASNKHGVVIKKDRPQTDLFQARINV